MKMLLFINMPILEEMNREENIDINIENRFTLSCSCNSERSIIAERIETNSSVNRNERLNLKRTFSDRKKVRIHIKLKTPFVKLLIL